MSNKDALLSKHTEFEVVADVDSALKDVGENGRFQCLKTLQYASLLVFGSFMIYPISFFQLQPSYLCATPGEDGKASGDWFKCVNTDFCENLDAKRTLLHKVDKTSPTSLDNWITKYDMTCWSKAKIGMLGVIFSLGMALGFIVLPRLSDFMGRRRIVLFGSLFTVVFMILCIFYENVKLLQTTLVCAGFCMAGRVVIGFAYMQDFMREEGIAAATAIAFFIDGLVMAGASAYFQFISKDWKWLLAGAAVPMSLATISLFFSSESIKYLHDTGKDHPERFQQLRDILTRIGRMNGKLTATQTYDKKFAAEIAPTLEMQIQSRLSESIRDMMTRKDSVKKMDTSAGSVSFCSSCSNITNLVVFTFAMIAVSHSFNLLSFYMKYLPGSIFINAYASSVADSVGYIACAFFAKCIKDKRNGFLLSYFLTASAAAFVAYETLEYAKTKDPIGEKNVKQEKSNWAIPAGVLFTKFGVALSFTYIYSSFAVYFKSQHMGLVMGVSNLFGKGFGVVSPMIAEMANPYPMGSVVVFSAVGFLLSFCLRKPEGLDLSEEDDEETEDEAEANRMV